MNIGLMISDLGKIFDNISDPNSATSFGLMHRFIFSKYQFDFLVFIFKKLFFRKSQK